MAELTHVSPTQNRFKNLVARYPLITFVLLAYAITWITWSIKDQIDFGIINGFEIISLISPALAALIVSAVTRSEPTGIPAGKRWRLFGVIGMLALGVMALVRVWNAADLISSSGIDAPTGAYPNFTAFIMDGIAAAVVAFVLSGVYSSRQGVQELLHSLDPRAHPVRWYGWLFAIGVYPAIIALGNAISAAIGVPPPATSTIGPAQWQVLNVLIMYPYFLIGGGGLEEIGWRAFLLPGLEKKYSPQRSTFILAVIWAFWHWPFLEGNIIGLVVYLFLVVAPLAILFTAVFHWTKGSLPIVILLHASINLTDHYMSASMFATSLWLMSILVIAFSLWRSQQISGIRLKSYRER